MSEQPRFSRWMSTMWLYTALRYGLFFVLWGVLYLLGLRGLHGFLAPLLALVLSVPLSFVLLARPPAQFTPHLDARLDQRHAQRADLDARLEPGEQDE